jgi:uncharacterized protein (DUF1330 family)
VPTAYGIITAKIHHAEAVGAYGKAAGPTLGQHGATALVADPDGEILEGEWLGPQTVAVEFESVVAARAWYGSPEYQAAAAIRHAATTSNATLVSGFLARVPPSS